MIGLPEKHCAVVEEKPGAPLAAEVERAYERGPATRARPVGVGAAAEERARALVGVVVPNKTIQKRLHC